MASAETVVSPPRPARYEIRAVIRTSLMGATLGTLVLNGMQTLLGSLSTLTLTHVLGPKGFGAYSFAFTWATLLTLPSLLGMTPLVVRHVATYSERAQWGHLRGIVRRTNQVVLLASILVAGVAAATAWLVLSRRSELRTPFLLAMLLVPVISLVAVRQASLSGLGRVVVGRAPDTVVTPGLLLLALLSAAAVTGGRYSASFAIAAQVVSATVAFGLGAWLLRRTMPTEAKGAAPAYETGAWVRGGLALLLASVAIALQNQLGTLVLGALKTSSATGIFSASARLAALASFLYLAASYPLMPALARTYTRGGIGEVERLAVRVGRGVMLVGVPLLCVVIVFAPTVLGILGGGFRGGAGTLRLLLVAEVVRQATGFGGAILLMTGHERVFARIALASTGLNLALAFALVPGLGVEGAAIAMVAGAVAQNVAVLVATWRHTGAWAAPLPLPARLRRAAVDAAVQPAGHDTKAR